MLAPVPAVMVSCRAGEDTAPNIITVAWAGTICSNPPMLSISLKKERYSHELISKSGEFYVNIPSQDLAKATDFCGVKSGRDIDKFESQQLTAHYLPALTTAPAIKEAPICIACKVEEVKELGSHDLFISRIVQVYVRDTLIGERGSLNLERAHLMAYRHGEYVAIGKTLGFFGYSIASPEVIARRMAPKTAPPSTERSARRSATKKGKSFPNKKKR